MQTEKLFADRIGGTEFGKVKKVFKFTIIDSMKREFIAQNPGVKLIDMGVGEPEERAADNIVKRLYDEALDRSNRIYPCNGTLPFKEAAARYMKRMVGQDFDPATEVIHCMGSKNALAQLPLAFLNPGDCVIQTVPGYPVLATMSEWLGAEVVNLKIEESNKFLPDLNRIEEIAKKGRLKILLLNYPNNPTGATAPLEFYKETVALAHKYNFVIVQDAAYSDYVFEGEYTSPFQVEGGRDVTIELYSLSKGYNMQGFRIGFVVSNPKLMEAYGLVKDNTDNGQFIAIQKAAVEALDNSAGFLNSNREKYLTRLTRTCEILKAAGIETTQSPATFYQYFKVPGEFQGEKFDSAQSFTNFLISKHGIVTVPWEEAGAHIRLSMTFEVGNKDFASEDQVFDALRERLVG